MLRHLGSMLQRTRRRRIVRGALIALSAGYLLVLLGMALFQRRLQYLPDPSVMDPAGIGLAQADVITLPTADGNRTLAWWIAPRAPDRPVFLYLHGNSQNLMARAERLRWLVQNGAGLLAISWRGYGGSPGSPTEAGLKADARAGYATLADKVAASRIILFGESLGTAMAVELAAEAEVAALVLDSPFSSALAVAEGRYPLLPVAALMKDPYRADLAAPRVRAPVLALSCRHDVITPFTYAQRLMDQFQVAKKHFVIDALCHVPSLARGGAREISAFLRDLGLAPPA